MIPFSTIRARAEKRKGGAEALASLLPPAPDPKALAKLKDDRVLAEMTKRVFSAGFAGSADATFALGSTPLRMLWRFMRSGSLWFEE